MVKIKIIKFTIAVVLVISLGGLVFFKLNIINIESLKILSPQISIESPKKPKLAMDKIKFAERYAYEFDNYLGSANAPGNMSRIIEDNAMLRKRYNPNETVRFTPAIANFNEGMPLNQARIQLIFGQDVIVEHQGWDEQEVNRRYSSKFNEPINNTPLNTPYSIFVKFSKPAKYQITALIDGEHLEDTKKVTYFIELYE